MAAANESGPKLMSHQEWLLERKLKLIREVSCRETLQQIEANDAEINQAEQELTKLQLSLQALKAEADETEDLAALCVEGKNEAERKARRIQALREDPAWGSLQGRIRELEASIGNLNDRLTSLRRNGKRLEYEIKYRIAILEAIAS